METPRGPTYIGLGIVAVLIVAGVAGLIHVLGAPTAAPPEHLVAPRASTEVVAYDVTPYERVCKAYVDEYGMVDYAGLEDDPGDLQAYLDQLVAVSPHSHIATFTTREQAIAYWINAYNAWMQKAVIDAHPTESVMDIEGVFEAKGRVCGGEDLSLGDIENGILRANFLEPRGHFALNCASIGCPWLPQEAFVPERLDEQLDRETRRFMEDASHLTVDEATRTVYLSQIFKWYQKDFLTWLTEEEGLADPTVLDYVKLYAPEGVAAQIGDDFAVEYLDYDWRLNDQNAKWGDLRRP